MNKKNSKKKQAKLLRIFRKIHRKTGAVLFIFFLFISITGLLLGWKSNSNGVLLPKTHEGSATDLKKWLPLDNLYTIACTVLLDSVSLNHSLELERIDIRKDKGVAKFIFSGYYDIQLDGATGNLLQVKRRRSDIIENIHDGSILDHYFGTTGRPIKLIYTSVMGLALLTFTITGFWLWYGPKRMKQKRNSPYQIE